MDTGRRRILPALLWAPILLLTWISALRLGANDTELSGSPLPPSVVGQVIIQVSGAKLEAHVCHLQDQEALGYCNTQGSRYSLNPAGLQEAAAYISDQFRQHGLAVEVQTFTPPNWPPDQDVSGVLTNVIGTLEGVAPPEERGIVIVSAHYDSTASGTSEWVPEEDPAPGADDNASGVAAVLEAARLLSEYSLWHTVRFIAFSGEEQGLHGSRHYAEAARLAGENIMGVINADMIGYEGDNQPWLEVHAGPDPPNIALARALTETIRTYELALAPQVVLTNPIHLSDHASFWDQGFPALLVIEDTSLRGPTHDFNPHYHTVEDTLDKIDLAYFTEMVRAVVGTTARLARPVGPDLRVAQVGPTEVTPGQTVTFTLVYSNAGTAPAAGVVLTDTLSHGLTYRSDSSRFSRGFDMAGRVTWNLGELDNGAGGAFVVTATVLSELPAETLLSSRVVIAGQDLDADGVNNVSTLEANIRPGWHVYIPLVVVGIEH